MKSRDNEVLVMSSRVFAALSQEENSSGRFLKAHSQSDKTRAGKIMAAVGKSLSFSSQQR